MQNWSNIKGSFRKPVTKSETAALPAEITRYTFADCLAWSENKRIEIIDGEAHLMAAPSSVHQEISEEYGREDVAKVNVPDGCFIELYKVFPE